MAPVITANYQVVGYKRPNVMKVIYLMQEKHASLMFRLILTRAGL